MMCCAWCKSDFIPRRIDQKYCSGKCKNGMRVERQKVLRKLKHPLVYKKCLNCGAEYKTTRKDDLYCSRTCQESMKRVREAMRKAAKKPVEYKPVSRESWNRSNPEGFLAYCKICPHFMTLKEQKQTFQIMGWKWQEAG